MRRGLFVVLLACALACRDRGRPDPNIRMAVSHERENVSTGSGPGITPSVPSRLEVPSEVANAYSGIRLTWKDLGSGAEGQLEVSLGGTARIPKSPLDVRADVFLPAFSMSSDVITSSGLEEANPAARISVLENGSELFSGWIFARFPDVHPFQHPRFSLRLKGGIRRATT